MNQAKVYHYLPWNRTEEIVLFFKQSKLNSSNSFSLAQPHYWKCDLNIFIVVDNKYLTEYWMNNYKNLSRCKKYGKTVLSW